jgi:hypothetical protein
MTRSPSVETETKPPAYPFIIFFNFNEQQAPRLLARELERNKLPEPLISGNRSIPRHRWGV